jgi:hypothetical protein
MRAALLREYRQPLELIECPDPQPERPDQAHADGIELVARGGTYSLVGYGGTMAVPSVAMIATEKTVQPTWSARGPTCTS